MLKTFAEIVMSKNIEKSSLIEIGFYLDIKDDWPPFSVEHLWSERRGGNYIIRSFPFFVKGIAYGDLICGQLDSSGYINNWSLLVPSGNSTIWVIEEGDTGIIEDLENIGCGIESGAIENLYSINVPKSVETEEVESVIDSYEDDNRVSIAYPAYRK